MPVTETKVVTGKILADLHAEVKAYMEQKGLTMSEFLTLAIGNELHPKIDIKEDKSMERTRTLAFQVDEDFFQRIKDYLRRNNITQKAFVIGLIEEELERDEALAYGESSDEETDEESDEDEDESIDQEPANEDEESNIDQESTDEGEETSINQESSDEDEESSIDQESADEDEESSIDQESANEEQIVSEELAEEQKLDEQADAHNVETAEDWSEKEENVDYEIGEPQEALTDEDSQSAETPEDKLGPQENDGDEDIEDEEADESYYPSM